MRKRITLYLFIGIISNTLFAQYSELKFDHITTSQGLSNNSVNSITQDDVGFIWIGTEDGLNRYDGKHIKVYQSRQDDPSSLFYNNVRKVFLDSRKNLWVIASNVLGLYNRDYDNFYNIQIIDSDIGLDNFQSRIMDIVEDESGNILIATINGRIYHIDNKGFTVNEITKETVLSINCIMPYNDSLIFIGTLKGFYILNRFTGKIEKKILIDEIKDRNLNIFSFLLYNDQLWLSTLGEGILIYDITTQKVTFLSNILKLEGEGYSRVRQVYNDKHNKFWIGDAEGIKFYDPENNRIKRYDYLPHSKYSINTAGIVTIFIDNQDNLWLGTSKGGVSVSIQKKKFHNLDQGNTSEINLSQNIVSLIIEDDDNNLWIGYFNGGIDVINRNSNTKISYTHDTDDPNSLGPSTVFEIFQDSRKNIWIGTYRGGLQRFDKQKRQFITYGHDPTDQNTISGNDIRSIVEDNDGNLWIVVHGVGIDKFDIANNKFYHFSENSEDPNTIPSNWNFKLLTDSKGTIWLASSVGLCKMGNNGFIDNLYINIPGDTRSLSNNYINYIFEDSKRNFWVGTIEGLNLFDRKNNKFKRFTTEDGLANEDIKAILEDNKGDIWFSTNKGISKLNLKWDTITKAVLYDIKNYNETDGILSYSFSNKACYKDQNTGEIYFGGSNGLTFFMPDSIIENQFIPPIVFTDFQLFYQSVPINKEDSPLNKHISQAESVKLKYSQNIITFQYTAFNYISPEKNQYAYLMEGFDKKWNYVGSENKATYTNLDPGEYIFRVKASNNDGIWNEEGTSIKLIIKPPFLRSIWGITTIIILISIIGYFLYNFFVSREKLKTQIELERLEAKKMHEIDEMKLKFFTQISHEFRTPLTLILSPIEKLIRSSQKNSKAINYYNIIYKNGQRLKHLINQLLDYRKNEEGFLNLEATHDDIIHFIEGIVSAFNHYASQRKIKFTFTSTVKSLKTWFDPDKLDKILYNLISNAIKYSADKGKIKISVSLIENEEVNKSIISKYIKIEVVDNGAGIPSESLDKIFVSFYQEKGKKPYRKESTGIGLAFIKELVKIHKGKISVRSEVGKGSTFEVLIPYGSDYLDNNQKVEKLTNLNERIATIKDESIYLDTRYATINNLINDESVPLILIVEDDLDLLHHICDELLPFYRIIEATNGYDGLIRATEAIPDIIVSDVVMPIMDGIELCSKIKNNVYTSHIPFILLTARSFDEQRIEGYKTGADGYLDKPFSISVLISLINNLIESRRLLRELYGNGTNFSFRYMTSNSIDEEFLKKAIKAIEQNMSNADFGSVEFAGTLNMSRAQLFRKVKALTNQSVSDLIRTIKLKKAAELLLEKKYAVYQIADAVGYSEQSNFTRDFHKQFGKTPTDYIASKSKN